ncbi:MFS transporter [Ectothiorhodospiraceae bacterium 2226]|nr:MFS transporter [Ectothiorhodospiraceae bacterium 2226]
MRHPWAVFALPRVVVVLGLASLLNDAASEMIAPLLPVFLTLVLGAGPAVVGLVEGVAEATSSLMKLIAGRLADRGWRIKPLVVGGYGLSNAVRPLIALALNWGWVLGLRFMDRIGKGLRTAPRDAWLAASVAQAHRGQAFGFHRALDHTGAMLGPLLAFALLGLGLEMREVFLASAVPGLLVILLLMFGTASPPAPPPSAYAPLRWRVLDARVRGMVVAAGGLALATAPEAFLVLWASARGLELVWVPLLWAAAHAVKALVAYPLGGLSDTLGRLPVVLGGWSARLLVLVALALAPPGAAWTWGLFLLYAATLAATEGAERALIGDYTPEGQRGTAFGVYHMLSGLAALPGAVLFGVLWEWVSMEVAFLTSAGLTGLSALLLLIFARRAARAPG